MIITEQEANTIRQWFNSVQDVTQEYLEYEDYVLAARIYEFLQMRTSDNFLRQMQVLHKK